MTIKELLEKRATLVNQARQIYDDAEKEKREPTDEERSKFDKAMEEADKLKDQADQMQGDLERRARLVATEKELTESRGRQTNWEQANKGTKDPPKSADPEVIELRKSVVGDPRSVTLQGERGSKEYDAAFRSYLRTGSESRALQKDSDVAGGYLSAPERFQAELIKAVDNLVFMRKLARVLPPLKTAESIGAPSLDADPADPTWVSELTVGNEDNTMAFGKRNLTPQPLAQYIKVSKKLVHSSAVPIDSLVRERLAYKIAVVQENAFLNGSGAHQPLGIFTASDDGIGTARDVSTGNTTTEVRFDGLIDALYSLKAQYRRAGLGWIFHRDGVKQIRKLKDGEGRYIWEASVRAGEPDTLFRKPVHESEYAPNTFETGLYVGIVGDFTKYWIVDALTMQIQVLLELFSLTNQNAYISRIEADGMPVLAEAFARVKLG